MTMCDRFENKEYRVCDRCHFEIGEPIIIGDKEYCKDCVDEMVGMAKDFEKAFAKAFSIADDDIEDSIYDILCKVYGW